MTNLQRKSIIDICKKDPTWLYFESGKREVNQDKIIEKECISKGFTYADFCNSKSKILFKLLA